MAGALAAAAILGCAEGPGERAAGPTIVVYVIDTLRRDRLEQQELGLFRRAVNLPVEIA